MSALLRLEAVEKRFGEVTAVNDLSLEVAPGELLTLLGPSGCGKTTTLRMIAGFETPTAGRILLEGREITKLPPQRRGFGMVFQNYALFPHLDVFENVAFGLKGRGASRTEIARRVDEALALVDLAGYERRKVQQLSGGQQQRVALARALAPEPRIILLDEPLSNLDAALRERTRAELRGLVERLGITAIFVTHDQEEAFELSDRIAIMEGGRLQQAGTPETLYLEPANPFVATFLGRANFLDGRVVGREGDWLDCELPGGVRWRVRGMRTTDLERSFSGNESGGPAPAVTASYPPGGLVRIMVRPEALRLHALHGDTPLEASPHMGDDPVAGLTATILERRFAGPVTRYRVRCGDAELFVLGGLDEARVGEMVSIQLAPDAVPCAFEPPELLAVDHEPEVAVRS